jgi:hypothetical protein
MSENVSQGQGLVCDGMVQHAAQLLECQCHHGALVVGVIILIFVVVAIIIPI